MQRRRSGLASLLIAVIACGGILAVPSKSLATELGLTPSQVYGLWRNINTVLLSHPEHRQLGTEAMKTLQEMPPEKFTGKRPKDVFAKASAFWTGLSEFLDLPPLAPTPAWVDAYARLIEVNTASDRETTPSQVFLLSSKILSAAVREFVTATDGRQPISDFYRDYEFTDKTPSDVFGLVDLAQRRLDLIRAKSEPPGQRLEGSN